jgi:hypothetical protein
LVSVYGDMKNPRLGKNIKTFKKNVGFLFEVLIGFPLYKKCESIIGEVRSVWSETERSYE